MAIKVLKFIWPGLIFLVIYIAMSFGSKKKHEQDIKKCNESEFKAVLIKIERYRGVRLLVKDIDKHDEFYFIAPSEEIIDSFELNDTIIKGKLNCVILKTNGIVVNINSCCENANR